jgi:lantibiotic biosynthesis protein
VNASPCPQETADLLARQLPAPESLAADRWQAQSLAAGATGVALAQIERAHTGAGTWQAVHSWVKAAVSHDISTSGAAGLYCGAPAIAFALHAAGADGTGRYARALSRLDSHVAAHAHRQVDEALARIVRAERTAFAEYDLFCGLTGIGVHMLRHTPGEAALGRILSYLVRLTEPLRADFDTLPGWWTWHDPNRRTSPGFAGGHANLGLAHGIAGPLALLAAAQRRGLTVPGQADAIERITAFLDSWRQDTSTGTWWPQWVTRPDLRSGRPAQPRPARPSWCYGTLGIARAQQLAAIATGNAQRRRIAEDAIADCLRDPAQLALITSPGLCHGWAGVYQTAVRASRDAITPRISERLPGLAATLVRQAHTIQADCDGLLEGKAGLVLALHTAARAAPPITDWDTCLIIS